MKFHAIAGGLNMMLSVALGAFGAHILKGTVPDDLMAVYQTGVQYHMAHALGLLLIAALSARLDSQLIRWSGRFIIAGIILFSGSLYVLSMSGIRALGAITPLGGVSFLLGWLLLIVAAFRLR